MGEAGQCCGVRSTSEISLSRSHKYTAAFAKPEGGGVFDAPRRRFGRRAWVTGLVPNCANGALQSGDHAVYAKRVCHRQMIMYNMCFESALVCFAAVWF